MSKTLLVADDSSTIQRVVELTFAQEDIRVIAVSDGEQALKAIDRDQPDIVLADVGMPRLDGYSVSSHVKTSPKLQHIPVLLLAGAFEPIDDDRARSARADGVLIKPFEPRVLVTRVQELLEAARAEKRPPPHAAPITARGPSGPTRRPTPSRRTSCRPGTGPNVRASPTGPRRRPSTARTWTASSRHLMDAAPSTPGHAGRVDHAGPAGRAGRADPGQRAGSGAGLGTVQPGTRALHAGAWHGPDAPDLPGAAEAVGLARTAGGVGALRTGADGVRRGRATARLGASAGHAACRGPRSRSPRPFRRSSPPSSPMAGGGAAGNHRTPRSKRWCGGCSCA